MVKFETVKFTHLDIESDKEIDKPTYGYLVSNDVSSYYKNLKDSKNNLPKTYKEAVKIINKDRKINPSINKIWHNLLINKKIIFNGIEYQIDEDLNK